MLACYLIECSGTYSKTSIGLWQFYRHESALDNDKTIIDFLADNNNSILFKYMQPIKKKQETTAQKMFNSWFN